MLLEWMASFSAYLFLPPLRPMRKNKCTWYRLPLRLRLHEYKELFFSWFWETNVSHHISWICLPWRFSLFHQTALLVENSRHLSRPHNIYLDIILSLRKVMIITRISTHCYKRIVKILIRLYLKNNLFENNVPSAAPA